MKRIITLFLFLFISLIATAQRDGISYQAVIIGPDALELPGVDSEGNYLPATDIKVRFIIYDSGNEIEFEEEQNATTDDFGRINLIIGAERHDDFEKISWNGITKDLAVEIDFLDGNGFVFMSREELTFVPYAYHRNITATDSLIVDGKTYLNGDLNVYSPTNLYSKLSVYNNNPTDLTGNLTVDGETNLNNILNVTGQNTTNLSGALVVGDSLNRPDDAAPTILNGSLSVSGTSSFRELEAETLTVTLQTLLNGDIDIDTDQQVVINSTVSTGDIEYTTGANPDVIGDDPGENIDNYPLLVQGSNHGIAIKVNGSRRNGNNFVSFWDSNYLGSLPMLWGRIEGEIPSEFENNADYNFDQASLGYDIYDADLDLAWATIDIVIEGFDLAAAYTDFRPCLGFGACTTSPGISDIAASIASVALVITKEVFAIRGKIRADNNRDDYDRNKLNFQGVTYASGAGDYAEYLLRKDPNEKIVFSDVVGVKGGKVSKSTSDAERVMVISRKPIVLGNMPQKNREGEYEKVAFMGQVPVKVFGKVSIGDYVVASGKNDGIGIAVKPSNINTKLIKKIVGIAWEENNSSGFGIVNVAVGLNVNDNNPILEKIEQKLSEQELVINMLKSQMKSMIDRFDTLENQLKNDSNNIVYKTENDHYDDRKYEILDTPRGEVIYFEMKDEDFELGLEMAKNQLIAEGINLEENDFWQKINNDPTFKTKLMNKFKAKFDNQIHYHKEVNEKAGH